MKWMKWYKKHMQELIWEGKPMDSQDIHYWRDRLFFVIMLYFLPLGTVGTISGVAIACRQGMYGMAAADILIWVAIAADCLCPGLSYRLRASLFIAICYGLAINMLINVGVSGPGLLWFIGIAILTTLLFEKAIYVIILWNMGIYAAVAVVASLRLIEGVAMNDVPIVGWISNGVSATVISIIVVASVRLLIDGLEGKIRHLTQIQKELMESREALFHAQKMDAVGRLAGGIAHDFNNMLTGIRGFAEVMDLRCNGDDKHAYYCREIIKTTERAAHLTGQLLTFSRKKPMKKEQVDLNEVVNDALALVRHMVNRTITVECELMQCPLWIHADSAQIQSVIINLAINARDAMEKGGQIRVKTDQTRFEVLPGNCGVFKLRAGVTYQRLTVSDEGCGMDEATLSRIFEPFFTTKDMGHGTGLGLSTVYGTVLSHDGGIFVHSVKGQGTAFEILFPKGIGLRDGDSVAIMNETLEG